MAIVLSGQRLNGLLRLRGGDALMAILAALAATALLAGAPRAQQVDGTTKAEAAAEAEATEQLEEAEASGAVVENADAVDWTGSWRSFWRGGQALMTLKQDGSTITGTYQPGDGKIEGTLDGVVITGKWMELGEEGDLEYAIAPDGQSFVGRFGNGEYWNGERLDDTRATSVGFGVDTPRAAFASLMSAANAAAGGDSVAELLIRRYLVFPEPSADERDRAARVGSFLRLINLSTFRVDDIPAEGESGAVVVELGPDGTDWVFPVDFVETETGRWGVVVPSTEILLAREAEALEALGVATFDELSEARRYSARQAMHDFVVGTSNWNDGGAEVALATLDMSEIPEKLRAIDGPLAAEYILQILNRLGQVVPQEVPDDANRRQPHVVYEHALGSIEIDRFEQEDGSVRWLFPAASLAAAPVIYEAMQNLPLADGMTATEPLTRAFAIRSEIKDFSPRLLKRPFLMENWQWIAVLASVAATAILSWVISRGLGAVFDGLLRLRGAWGETRTALARAFGWPGRAFAAGAILTLLLREIGLTQDISAIGNGIAAVMLLLGGTFFVYHVVNAILVWMLRSASETESNVDDIAVALGGGLAKVMVIVGGVILSADVLGLPYEGVIAGLGVGGLAFGIAAKDAVQNFIGAGILASDRPFKKGDRIEAGGNVGTVEHVGLRSTRLRADNGTVLVVPNSQLSDGKVNNYGPQIHGGAPEKTPVDLKISIAHDTPRDRLDAFVDGLKQVFAAQPLAMPGATAALAEIGPASLGIDVNGSLATADTGAVLEAKHALLAGIVALAQEMGVRFASPSVTVQMMPESADRPAIQSAA
jgi:small-conductance mechanosensitive channel